jgi:hypothetical protein
MPLAGTGAILIWNDIAPEGRDVFYGWHLAEHIPERLAVPGFLRGSRYIAADGDTQPEFFTLYETANPAVATSAPYLTRLNAPTPWTRTTTAHFRNTSRALTTVVASHGAGPGGVIATLRLRDTVDGHASLDRLRSAQNLSEFAELSRITGVHGCATDAAMSATKTAESRDRTDIQAAPIGALLIEGCDAAAVEAAVNAILTRLAIDRGTIDAGVYRLEHARSR